MGHLPVYLLRGEGSARWKSVQEAKLRGLSLRAIAGELGIHRETAKKYALADIPPVRRTATETLAQQPDRVPAA